MFHGLVLKVTRFQLPTLKCFSTVIKNIFWGGHAMSSRVNLDISTPVSFNVNAEY